ncbi:MAG: hypothetical protein WAV89_06270 [Ignavibacteriaceae bacterium]
MFLVVGTLLLPAGIVLIINQIIFRRLPKPFGYTVIYLTAGLLIFTGTVHGIWLGITILIIGYIWLKYFVKNKVRTGGN